MKIRTKEENSGTEEDPCAACRCHLDKPASPNRKDPGNVVLSASHSFDALSTLFPDRGIKRSAAVLARRSNPRTMADKYTFRRPIRLPYRHHSWPVRRYMSHARGSMAAATLNAFVYLNGTSVSRNDKRSAQQLLKTLPKGAYTSLRVEKLRNVLDWRYHLNRLNKSCPTFFLILYKTHLFDQFCAAFGGPCT